MSAIAERLRALSDAIAEAAVRAGRDPAEVGVLAVSKKHPPEAIREAAAAGQKRFGENYAQELTDKAAALEGETIEWHFIGHLQRNKVKQVIGLAQLIHSVDSARLVREIDKRAAAAQLVQPILVEVNVGGEQSKSGVSPEQAGELIALARQLGSVRIEGLMTMPPLAREPGDNRALFARLRQLRDRYATAPSPLPALSMGTTADYAAAVKEGATLVRVGTAIFGPRPV